MVSPSAKRRAIREVVESGRGGVTAACRAVGLSRASYYRLSRISLLRRALRQRIVSTSQAHPRCGYRRITALLRREGHPVNAKRVQRVRRQEGLQVRRKQRKLRRLGVSTAQRKRAQRPGEVWSWDFVEDQTENGTRLRMLTVIDEYTREWLAVHVDWSIRAVDVIRVVEKAMQQYGPPGHIRSDNGPEFIAYAIQDWLRSRSVKTIYIEPGAPWENAYIESFHDKLRDECLKREIFGSLLEARVVIEEWRRYYNTERLHSSLGYRPPAEFASRASAIQDSGRAAPSLRPELPENKTTAELYF